MRFGLTVVTLGVADVGKSAAFYAALGLTRKFATSGEAVAFFDAGGVVLALYGWDALAEDAGLPTEPANRFRGTTLACNCNSPEEVDAMMAHALKLGAKLVKPAQDTFYGGYGGYFSDPDGHLWEVVRAPGIVVGANAQLSLPA